MKEKKHHQRIAAEKAHATAMKTLRLAENQPDEVIFNAAWEAASVTRKALVEMEIMYPTTREARRDHRILTLRNRGLEI